MTLVEVIASLALLGSLLGASVIAQARLTRQWNAAQQRAEAVAALDAQLHAWRALDAFGNEEVTEPETSGVTNAAWPVSGEGPLGTGPWWWRAETITDPSGLGLGITLIRYTAFDPADLERRAVAALDVFRYESPQPEDESVSSALSGTETAEASQSLRGFTSGGGP